MEWKPATVDKDDRVNIPERWLLLHYFEALNILFRTENALRVFVYLVLKNKYWNKWESCQIQTGENQQRSISDTAKQRINQAQGFGYLGYDISAPLMYLNSGELTRMIVSETYWDIFKVYFKGKKDVIQNKLEEVANVRNSLAHFRPIRQDDVDATKQNVRHTFLGIEACLHDMLGTTTPVPTNTPDEWYKKLSTLGSESCKITLFQNSSQEWIRLKLAYSSELISTYNYGDEFSQYQVLKIIAPAIVDADRKIASFCTFCDEERASGSRAGLDTPTFNKSVNITFKRSAIEENLDGIEQDIRYLLNAVEDETQLIKKDNLARGKFVGLAPVTASLVKLENGRTIWRFLTSSLDNPSQQSDPTEYWGIVNRYQSDYIAGTRNFPWMPIEISNAEGFF